MNIEEYKKKLENNKLDSNIFIFKCNSKDQSDFIFHQYLNKYIDDNELEIRFIESISSLYTTNLFSAAGNNFIYILELDKLEEFELDKINDIVWIKCNKIPKDLVTLYDDIIINLPKLEEWQIKDYIDCCLPALKDEHKEKLFLNYKDNLFRLELELDKLKQFDKTQTIYTKVENQLFVDSTEYNIFDFANCVIRRDIQGLNKLKDTLSIIDIDPFGLIKILLNNFRHVIDIQLAKNPTPEYVGVSNKQFWAIRNYSCGFYSRDELIYIYQLLSSLDSKIKSGYISTKDVIDYIICKIMLLR